jgi:hypothetical protein
MTIKTLSAIAVRIIGWLVVLEGIKSFLSLVLLAVIRNFMEAAAGTPHAMTGTSFMPIGAVVIGLVELSAGFTIIQNSEFLGRILSKGLDERL